MAQAPLVIKQQLLPLTKTYGTGNRRLFITLHQTGGPQNGLNAQWMANYQRDMSAPSNAEQKSWHYQVDDKEAIQSFSHDVHSWQAGVGKNLGNLDTISIESCINADGNYAKTIENTAKLMAWVCYLEKLDPRTKIKTHRDWSGKNCPEQIYAGKGGFTLAKVIDMTVNELAKLNAQDKAPAPVTPVPVTPPKGDDSSMTVSAQQILDIARPYVNVTPQHGTNHKYIINKYNAHRPLARSTKMILDWDWCAAFVSFLFIEAGATHLVGTEIGVQRYVDDCFKKKGIWIGKVKPQAGDIVTFDWDGGGWADHIGIVEKISGNTITTIEGNTNRKVARNTFAWNDWRIQGYARPNYGKGSTQVDTPKLSLDAVAKEVMAGKWGNGADRNARLTSAGYNAKQVQGKVNQLATGNQPAPKPTLSLEAVAKEVLAGKWGNGGQRATDLKNAGFNPDEVQKKVNQLVGQTAATPEAKPEENLPGIQALKYGGATLSVATINKVVELGKRYNIMPSFLIVMLQYEALWGTSNVAKSDNNWAGMTWSASYVGNPKIKKTKGSSRPSIEGGNYTRYASTADFLEDWVYLLRPGHFYKVSGVTNFDTAVKGLFKVGGARYDYAAQGHPQYGKNMAARRAAIEKANPGMLSKIDKLQPVAEEAVKLKALDVIAKEVINMEWSSGAERTARLTVAGYDAKAVQAKVNELIKADNTKPQLKPLATIAKEVIDGKWGNGAARNNKLTAEGYNANAVQAEVNKIVQSGSIRTAAKEVIDGKWGNGADRQKKLRAAGLDPAKVQAEVNKLLG